MVLTKPPGSRSSLRPVGTAPLRTALIAELRVTRELPATDADITKGLSTASAEHLRREAREIASAQICMP